MGDNDFPAALGFLNQFLPNVPRTEKPKGYFQEELEGFRNYSQKGTTIPPLDIGQSYRQTGGGPILSQTVSQAGDSSMFPMSQEEFRQRVRDQQDRHTPEVPLSPFLKDKINKFWSKWGNLSV